MANLNYGERAIASSKCRLLQNARDFDPLFCKVVLTDEALIFLNLAFVNEQGDKSNFVLDMMTYGECGLVKEYRKLI